LTLARRYPPLEGAGYVMEAPLGWGVAPWAFTL
jgi:hypothetical protein